MLESANVGSAGSCDVPAPLSQQQLLVLSERRRAHQLWRVPPTCRPHATALANATTRKSARGSNGAEPQTRSREGSLGITMRTLYRRLAPSPLWEDPLDKVALPARFAL